MNRFIVPAGFLLAAVVSVGIWWNLPALGPVGEQMKQGGYLVAALIMLIILQTSFIIERLWRLKKAQGRGPLPDFLNNVRNRLPHADVDGAIAGIVAYNVFVTRVDGFNYMMDEASYEAVQLLAATAGEKR